MKKFHSQQNFFEACGNTATGLGNDMILKRQAQPV